MSRLDSFVPRLEQPPMPRGTIPVLGLAAYTLIASVGYFMQLYRTRGALLPQAIVESPG